MEMTSYAPGTPNWIDLGSPNPTESAAFYGALFGWEAVDQGPDAGGYHMFEIGGKPVAGLGPQMQPDVPPYWMTYMSVADTDATVAAVRDAGGMVFVEPMDVFTSGRMAVCADAVGAAFSVWQPGDHIGAELVNEPNTLCWNELTTRDTDAATAFYSKVFGWTATVQQMDPMPYTEWQLAGRSIGGMMRMDESFPPEVPSHWMVYFSVADTDATVAKVGELGGEVCVPATDIPPGRFAVVNDPHGAMFSVLTMAQAPARD